jgi:hypothetical protein
LRSSVAEWDKLRDWFLLVYESPISKDAAPMRIVGYILDHWRGNLSLLISFWINGSCTAAIVALLTLYGSDELDYSDLSEASWLLATLTLYCVSLVISVWSIVGIWRSATSYQQKGGALKWSLTARLFALLGALGFASEFSQATLPVFQTLLVRAGIENLGPPATLKVTGRTLHIDGTITHKVTERFKALIDQHPDIEQISISSFGGRTNAGVAIASIISKRKLNTVAVGECSSACTFIFLSGKIRMFDINSSLGFHSPKILGLSDLESQSESPEVTEAYEAAGLSDAFISKALGTPSASMWYPSDDILIRQGAVHLFTQARIKYEHEQQVEYFRTEGPLKIDDLTKVVGAKIDNTALTYTYVIAARSDEVDWDGMAVMAKYDANAAICRNAVTYLMVKSGASYTYLYVDKNGEKVGSVVIDKCYNTV